MTDAQQRAAAKAFAKNWKDRGYEKGDSQIFWIWHKSLGSAIPVLKNLNPGNTAKSDNSYKGSFPLQHRCLSPKFVTEYLRYKHIG